MVQRQSDEVLHGASEIGEFLSHVFFPSRLSVEPLGDELRALTEIPTMQAAVMGLRSVSIALVHVDLPVRLRIDAVDGPLMIMPVGYGTDPREVTVRATPDLRQEAAVAPTGARRDQAVPGGYVCALVGMSQAVLEREAVAITGAPPARPVHFEPVLDLTSAEGQQLEAAVTLLVEQIKDQSALLSNDVAERRLEQMVLDMFLLAADHIKAEVFDEDGTSISTPWIRHAVELIRDRPAQPWTVPELSRRVVVSPRALYEGFRRELDTTPMGYLQDVRLTLAHVELSSSDKETTVSAIASRCGFQHLGRFAQVYRAKFGETPSQTLQGTGSVRDDVVGPAIA